MTSFASEVETVLAFSAHPDPATAVGEAVGAVHDSRVMATTVLGLFAGSWPTGSRSLAWRTVCRMLQPENAAAGGLPEILYPRADSPATSDRNRHRSLALIATDNGPAEIVIDGPTTRPDFASRPSVTFTGSDVVLSGDRAGGGSDQAGDSGGTGAANGSTHRFLAVDSEVVGPSRVTVAFDPADTAMVDVQGVRLLATERPARLLGREITAIDHRSALEVVNELTVGIDRPDLRPETLLIGVGDCWCRIIAVDPVTGSLILDAAPHGIVDAGSERGNSGAGHGAATAITFSVAIAIPDLVDGLLSVERRAGRSRRTLLAVSAQYSRRPNDVGADQDVDDMVARLAPLVIPSPGLLPGAVRSLVFGAPPVR